MNSSTAFDWKGECQRLLDQTYRPICPEFESAWTLIGQGQISAAAIALQSLEEEKRFFISVLLELAVARSGIPNPELVTLCESVHNMSDHAVDSLSIPRALSLAWCHEVGIHLPPDVLVKRESLGQRYLLRPVIQALCNVGKHEAAQAYALKIKPYCREDVAELWALIAHGLPEPARSEALERAAMAGNARPMIQNGGEEASAHGNALESFAANGVSSDHPATQIAFKGLMRLAKNRAPKDVRADGTYRAAVAAAIAAKDHLDSGWYDIAILLSDNLWDAALKERSAAAIALAAVALNYQPFASLKPLAVAIDPQSSADPAVVLLAFAQNQRNTAETPESLAELSNQGIDVHAKIEALLKSKHRAAERFQLGCRLGLSDERLEVLLAAVPERDRAETLVKGASYGFTAAPARKLRYLKRGYPEGDKYGHLTEDVLPYLSIDLLNKGECFFASRKESEGLMAIACQHILENRVEDAARVIARLDEPIPDSVQFCLSPRAVEFSLPDEQLSIGDVKNTLKATKTAESLYALIPQVADEPIALQAVFKASRLKKFSKRIPDLAFISQIRLMEGDFEESVAIAEKFSRLVRADNGQKNEVLCAIAHYLKTHPTEVTLELAHRLTTALKGVHPQFSTAAVHQLSRALTLGGGAQRNEIVHAIESSTIAMYRRSGDHVFPIMGIAEGYCLAGDVTLATQYIQSAVAVAKAPATYTNGLFLVEALARIRPYLDNHFFQHQIGDALEGCLVQSRPYQMLSNIQAAILSLWKSGDVEATLAFLNNQAVPLTVRQDIKRSIWADIAISPDPLKILQSTWPQAALPKPVALALIQSTVTALRVTQHPDLAKVSPLLKTASVA